MSEAEVTKHLTKSYRIWKRPGINWKEKITEIFIEILIIVFAVSLSLYLERWREKSHDHHIAREFMTGLRHDLLTDIDELGSDSAWYDRAYRGFRYFYTKNKYEADSVNEFMFVFNDITQLIPNTNRYEALKSSGKLTAIENDSLLNNIIDLYQEKIPALVEIFIKPFNDFKTRDFYPYMYNNYTFDTTGANNLEVILHKPVARNYLRKADGAFQIAQQYHQIIERCKIIINQIDEEL